MLDTFENLVRNPNNGRYICSAEMPMPLVTPPDSRWEHWDVEELNQSGGYPAGDIVKNRCINCGHTWTQELPQ